MRLTQPSGESAPRLLYTGTGGDTMAKKILCYSGNAGIIDGGDSGGLTIAGSSGGVLRYSNSSSTPGVSRLVFQGDGATENAYDTVLDNRVNTSERGTAAAQPLTIVKRARESGSSRREPTITKQGHTPSTRERFALARWRLSGRPARLVSEQ